MPDLIPPQYKFLAIGLALMAWTVSVYLYATNHESLSWRAAIAEQKAEAAAQLITANKASADKDNANIVSALTVQEEHDRKIAAIESSRDGYAQRYTDSLRARCGQNRSGQLPATAVDPNKPQINPPGSEDRLSEVAGRDFSTLGVNANKLAATVRECIDWAARVGR